VTVGCLEADVEGFVIAFHDLVALGGKDAADGRTQFLGREDADAVGSQAEQHHVGALGHEVLTGQRVDVECLHVGQRLQVVEQGALFGIVGDVHQRLRRGDDPAVGTQERARSAGLPWAPWQ
jgi:hypothetical protein